MNPALRNLSVAFGIATLSILGACDREPAPPKDVLAQDSSLNLAVMTANQGSAGDTVASGLKTAVTPATPAPAMLRTPTGPQTAAVPVRSLSNSIPLRRVASQARRAAPARRVRLASSISQPRARRTTRTVNSASARVINRRQPRGATVYSSTKSVIATAPASEATAPARIQPRSSSVIPVGSSLSLTADRKICSNTAKVGQQFNTRLAKDVMGADGVVIPEGTTAVGEIASIGNNDPGIAIRIASLTFGGRTYPVSSQVVYTEIDKVQSSSRGSGAKILVGAGMGALLGRMIGGNTKSTVMGAVGGAAAGGVIANTRSTQYARCVPSGGQILARLTEPLRVASSE